MRVGAVILSAGAATRMGQIKQLLLYRGRPLVAHAVDQASVAGFSPIITVLGAKADDVRSALDPAVCEIVVNEGWEAGMGSSLQTGLKRLLQMTPDVEGLAVLLADQPRIAGLQLASLRQAFEKNKRSIVAAEYGGAVGVPAIFPKELFPTLLRLPPETGARHLLRDAGSVLFRFPMPEAAVDVDTPSDYLKLS